MPASNTAPAAHVISLSEPPIFARIHISAIPERLRPVRKNKSAKFKNFQKCGH